jgi:reactive chlorine resistance protein C
VTRHHVHSAKIDEYALQPADAERYEVGLHSLLGAVEALEATPGPTIAARTETRELPTPGQPADQGENMGTRHTPVSNLASAGVSVMRYGLATNLLWIGALKFQDYEVKNIEPLVTSSPLISPLRHKLGAQKLARLIGVTEITLGALIAARPFAPQASAVGSIGAVGMFLVTLSFLATTREAWQEGQGVPKLSVMGQSLSKDSVLLGASLLTAAESLRAARAANRQ